MMQRLRKYFEYRPILKKWIISGLVITSMTGLIMLLSAFFMVHQLYQKEEALHAQTIEKNSAILNGVCKEVVAGAQTLIGDSRVKIAAKRGDETVEDRMRINSINSLVNEYSAIHGSFGDVFLFFPSQKPMTVLTTSEYLALDEGISQVKSLNLIAEYNQNLFSGKVYSEFKIAGSESDPQIYYSMSTQYADPFENQDAVLLIKISKSALEFAVSDDYSYILATEDGRYIKLGSEELSDEFITRCLDVTGFEKIDGRMVCSVDDSPYGIRMIAILESGMVESSMRPFILGVLLYFLSVMMIVAATIIHFLRKQYVPIEHLIRFMDERSVLNPDVDEDSIDEFKRIEAGVGKAISEMNVSREEFFKFRNDNETRLVNLLNYGREPIPEENEKPYKYQVVSYDIDNPTGESFEQIERDQLWFIIHNVSEELIGPEHLLATGGLAHWFYNIVQFTGENDITVDELRKQVNTVCSFIREKFEIALVANVSDIHDTKAGITAAHKEAMLVREYRIYVGALENVAYYKELSLDDDGKRTLTSWNQMEQVQNLYRLHRPEEASNLLNNIVSEAIDTAKETTKEEADADKFGKTAALAEKAKEYVDEKYSDKDMNVNSIADELSVNNSYLSRTFKQIYGIGMLEYINNVRLENAVKIMETGVTVKDAADQVGFSTPRPLIRCFREKYGTTPGEYFKGKGV